MYSRQKDYRRIKYKEENPFCLLQTIPLPSDYIEAFHYSDKLSSATKRKQYLFAVKKNIEKP
jgi:hypothetical protein